MRPSLRSPLFLFCVVVACAGPRPAETAVPSEPTAAPSTDLVLGARGVRARFAEEGASIELGDARATLRATTLARVARSVALAGSSPTVVDDGVESERAPGVVEWWRALPTGLEHGFTLADPPPGEGELAIELELGGLRPRQIGDDAIALDDETGAQVATYGSLVALDATGRRLPARMVAQDGGVSLVVDDARATYPVVVDPLLLATPEALLVGATTMADDEFGWSVALSSDATRAAIGAFRDDVGAEMNAGTVRVHARTGTTWAAEAILSPPGCVANDRCANEVAISADGTRVVVGAPYDDATQGSAHVFVRAGTAWSLEASLSRSGTTAGDLFGYSVAFATDASRVVVGAPGSSLSTARVGFARVYLRTGGTWTQEAILTPAGGALSDFFGGTVAMSGDGSRVLVGAAGDDVGASTNAGTVRSFVRSGTTWTEEPAISAVGSGTNLYFPSSLALTPDASRALVGVERQAVSGFADAGTVRVLVRTGTVWAQEAMLASSDPGTNENFGTSVSISSDGARAVVGVPGDDESTTVTNSGTTRLFSRTGTVWAEEATLRHPSPVLGDTFGTSVAISADGTRAIAGAPNDSPSFTSTADGSARVFVIEPITLNGTPCTRGATCQSGFCNEGVCCDAACNGTCDACTAARTGVADGTCAPLSAAVAPTITCRAAADLCDFPEVCSPTMTTCPADVNQPSTHVCRIPAGPCDAAETCNGSTRVCPGDARIASGTPCRASAGACDGAEVCDGTSVACPGDTVAPMGTVCRASVGPCDGPEACNGVSSACPTDVVATAGTTCRAAINVCDVSEVCDGASNVCPADAFAPATTSCGAAASGPCDGPDHCSGIDTSCDPGYLVGTVCRAATGSCDLAETCVFGNAACPADAVLANGILCRDAVSLCDVAEACTGTSPACPLDQVRPPGLVCRPAVPGGCDVAETCGGVLPDCPPDLVQPSSTACGPAPSGVCDLPDHCDGTLPTCVATFDSGTLCRASTGGCDLPETCSGTSAGCPIDRVAASGFPCGGSTGGACGTGGLCDGATTVCPPATIRPSGTVCLPAMSGNPCDLDDLCDGTTDVCQPRYATAGTSCGTATAGPCDAPDSCSGTSADCVAAFLSGTECRAAAGPCDAPESCAGSSVDCPADAVVSAGLSCRASTDTSCDPEEVCDGIASSCPADESTCGSDGGGSDGGSSDAGTGTDAPPSPGTDAGAPPPVVDGGCQCRASPAGTRVGALAVGMLVLAVGVRQARRGRR